MPLPAGFIEVTPHGATTPQRIAIRQIVAYGDVAEGFTVLTMREALRWRVAQTPDEIDARIAEDQRP